ncbi:MAG: TIGR03960 family B12-binding radical SAM protein [Candidatus Aminicenantes bacterium]|nr:MAG: TIGR03960 family B12-binding radical SAM protein [Candidatus Aminicenantes bacterium]
MRKKVDLEELLKNVEKPGRYLGGEWNEIRKSPENSKAKIALIFPDVYEVGMSYLGQKILYSVLNDHPDFLAERVFVPWIDFEERLRSSNIPLYSLENRIPLSKFDILGFSLLYELNYSNIMTILELGNIPFFSFDRDLKYPLIMAGGPAVFNPEPVVDIFDLFVVGDGEEAFIEIVEKFVRLREDLKEKKEILRELSDITGVYVPSLYTPYRPPKSFLLAEKPIKGIPAKVEKRILFPFHQAPFPEKIIVPNVKVVFDRVAVEVARGCPHQCRFCQASSIYFPSRVKSPSFVMKKILNSLKLTGYEDTSLSSLSVSDYPYFDGIVEALMSRLVDQKISLSVPSLRPEGLSSELAKNISKVRKTGFTLVPEAGTERLRCVINKKLGDEEIYEACSNAFSLGWRLLKLYFMVGLPTERDEDLEGITKLIEAIIRIGYKNLKSAPKINLSISSFIPKPHTPFQWLKMEDEKILKEKHKFLKSRLKRYPFVKIKKHPIKNSILEAVFSRGDRRLNQVLLQAWKRGVRFDSWADCFNFRIWEDAFEFEKIDYKVYLQAQDRDAILPWEHIETGIKKSHLLQELDKALKENRSLSCFEDECSQCQGCSFPSLLERKFPEKIETLPDFNSIFGKKTWEVIRYRAFYSKLKAVRFISHTDLNNIIQRGFRRAGVSVVHSEGFHPKMKVSYLPALPLGMEGKAEVIEFRSQYLFSEREFVSHVNNYLPEGVKFLALKRLMSLKPSLTEDLRTLVYSVDLRSREIKEALKTICRKEGVSLDDDFEKIEGLVNDYLTKNQNESVERISVDREDEKLFLHLKHSPQRALRPQEIVEAILKVKNPVFVMAREKVLFK